MPQCLKPGLVALWSPFEPGCFLREPVEWFCNCREIMDKSPIIPCQAEELLDISLSLSVGWATLPPCQSLRGLLKFPLWRCTLVRKNSHLVGLRVSPASLTLPNTCRRLWRCSWKDLPPISHDDHIIHIYKAMHDIRLEARSISL